MFQEPQLPGGTPLSQHLCHESKYFVLFRLFERVIFVFARSCFPCVEVTSALHCLGWSCTLSTLATTLLFALISH